MDKLEALGFRLDEASEHYLDYVEAKIRTVYSFDTLKEVYVYYKFTIDLETYDVLFYQVNGTYGEGNITTIPFEIFEAIYEKIKELKNERT